MKYPTHLLIVLLLSLGLQACSGESTPTAETQKQTSAQQSAPAPVPAPDPKKIIKDKGYLSAKWDPIHFKPAIDQATDEQCLSCHQEVLSSKVRETSPAGLKSTDTLAWYQTLDTYEGEQQNFHWRHLRSPFAQKVMQMSCTTCHQGNDPREESNVPTPAAGDPAAFTLRKMVNPEATCLMCHGQFPGESMGLPGKWETYAESMQNNCLSCHAAIRTNRHKVNFLKPEGIEAEGAKSGDSCYGCHGGRAWYRISFPYPRHTWEGAPDTPEWAKNRPTESHTRFLTPRPGSK